MIDKKQIDKKKYDKEFDCPTDENCLQQETFDKQGRLIRLKLVPLNEIGRTTAYTKWYQYNDDGTVEEDLAWLRKVPPYGSTLSRNEV